MLCFLGPFKHILIILISTKCPITNCKGWLDIWDVRNARNDKYSEVEKDTLWCSLWEPSLMFDDASLSWTFDHKHKHLIVLLEIHDNENEIESISWKISASSMGFDSSLWLHLFCFAMCANTAAPVHKTKVSVSSVDLQGMLRSPINCFASSVLQSLHCHKYSSLSFFCSSTFSGFRIPLIRDLHSICWLLIPCHPHICEILSSFHKISD